MELLPGETILWQGRPSWRAHLSHFLVWIPLALLPVIIAGIVRANDAGTGLPYWQWLAISLLLVAGVVVYDGLRRYATLYVVTTERLRVRTGILSRREKTAAFGRVQNVNVSQSLMDRLLRVGTVEFDTAGSDVSDSGFDYAGIADPHGLVRIVAHHSRVGDEPTVGL
ncbi:PH domain-containing protein [Miltoncostaea marina]|uniref:PH domain-containing protein n=1 Tax=Miltoncostaea marina TaxID=2843215 RepID=UPI001C3CDA19|nr:PH domain-containing protein [Miltoncostaea marina]